MVLFVKAKEIDYGDVVWLRIDGNDIEILEEFEPDPFSRVANVLKGKIVKVGIYRFVIIGDVAYTRGL